MTSSISGAKLTDSGTELELAGFDLGEVEHVVDEAEQVGAGAVDTRCSGSGAFSVPKRAALVYIISVSPMMALSGVRSSWLILARNCDLCWLATSSWRLLSSISWNSRAFWIASTDCAAKVCNRSTVFLGNSPGALAAHHQHADDPLGPEQRRDQQRAVTGAQDDVVGCREGSCPQIGELHRRALGAALPMSGSSDADMLAA